MKGSFNFLKEITKTYYDKILEIIISNDITNRYVNSSIIATTATRATLEQKNMTTIIYYSVVSPSVLFKPPFELQLN